MFEAAEVGRKLEKEEYKAQVPVLRAELLDAQQHLLQAPFPVIVLFAGVDAAGKSETASLLNEWMDPHWIVTRGYMDPSEEELERPRLWRYWRDLPPKGRLALFLSAWYSSPIRHRGRTASPALSSMACSRRLPRSSARSPTMAPSS
jgi:polyphosphate kinase 2 (PPK2 family)